MKIVVGSDHAGFPLKAELVAFIRQRGHEVTDACPEVIRGIGSYDPEPVDFPDIAAKLAAAVTGGQAERGPMVCGTCACPEASEGWVRRSAPTR
jgi:ribose 5-phosphate isomerase B